MADDIVNQFHPDIKGNADLPLDCDRFWRII